MTDNEYRSENAEMLVDDDVIAEAKEFFPSTDSDPVPSEPASCGPCCAALVNISGYNSGTSSSSSDPYQYQNSSNSIYDSDVDSLVVESEEDEPDPTHTCVCCDGEKYIESEPRSTYSWCDHSEQVTTWRRLDSDLSE